MQPIETGVRHRIQRGKHIHLRRPVRACKKRVLGPAELAGTVLCATVPKVGVLDETAPRLAQHALLPRNRCVQGAGCAIHA